MFTHLKNMTEYNNQTSIPHVIDVHCILKHHNIGRGIKDTYPTISYSHRLHALLIRHDRYLLYTFYSCIAYFQSLSYGSIIAHNLHMLTTHEKQLSCLNFE